MSKNILTQSLIFAACILSCGVVGANQEENTPKTEAISVIADPSQLQEGMNLLSTAPSGHQLYAQVTQGVVTHYLIKDSADAVVPCTQMRDQEYTTICVDGAAALCWEVSEYNNSYTVLN